MYKNMLNALRIMRIVWLMFEESNDVLRPKKHRSILKLSLPPNTPSAMESLSIKEESASSKEPLHQHSCPVEFRTEVWSDQLRSSDRPC